MNVNDHPTPEPGVVCRKYPSSCLVIAGKRTISCALPPEGKGKIAQSPVDSKRRTAPPAVVVGDRVQVQSIGPDAGRIVEILPRRRQISRRAAGSPRLHPVEQVLAANISQVVAICSVDHHPPEWTLLDRFLALAEQAGVPGVILLSKSDLLPESGTAVEEILAESNEFRRIGYAVIESSVKTGRGLEEIRTILRRQTSILLGKSGVGKSSLLNALYPGWGLRVSGISRFGEGHCTTANAELIPLECGGAVVDTPGLRSLELWETDGVDPACWFREMRVLVGQCRFGTDCRHMEEPGCALRRAVEAGRISPRRFRSLLLLAGGTP